MASESLPGVSDVSGTLQDLAQVKLHGQRLAMQKGLPHKVPDSSYGLAFQKHFLTQCATQTPVP